MKKYTRPYTNITAFSVEDIITASGNGVIVDANDFTGENATMYSIYKDNSNAGNTNVSVFTW